MAELPQLPPSVLMRIGPSLARLESLYGARIPLGGYDLPEVAEELTLARDSLERLADAVQRLEAVEAERFT